MDEGGGTMGGTIGGTMTHRGKVLYFGGFGTIGTMGTMGTMDFPHSRVLVFVWGWRTPRFRVARLETRAAVPQLWGVGA